MLIAGKVMDHFHALRKYTYISCTAQVVGAATAPIFVAATKMDAPHRRVLRVVRSENERKNLESLASPGRT